MLNPTYTYNIHARSFSGYRSEFFSSSLSQRDPPKERFLSKFLVKFYLMRAERHIRVENSV